MLLAHGAVQDRPFGKTVGTIARRAVTGQLTVEHAGETFAIVFVGGHVVAADSPSIVDSAAAIALATNTIDAQQVRTIEKWLAAVPDADALEVIARVALLSAHETLVLRRRVIAQRAARILALEHGDFVLTSTITLAIAPDCEMDVGGVIYQAGLVHVAEPRLREIAKHLGSRFELRAETHDLADYGFGERQRPLLRALAQGLDLAVLEAIADTTTRRSAFATIYALASCGALFCETAQPALRLARGTTDPMQHSRPLTVPAPPSDPHDSDPADAAFARGQAALRAERLDDAIYELERASELAPNEPAYFAALAWARFVRAPDKQRVANETRRMLGRAIARAEGFAQPRYYLGMVERMLDRSDRALEHFTDVLGLDPHHREAAAEIRCLQRKL